MDRSCPLAAALSAKTKTAVHIWSYDYAYALGVCLFAAGKQVEFQMLGKFDGIVLPPAQTGKSRLGKLLHAPDFSLQQFAARYKHRQDSAAALAAIFNSRFHLADVMDLVDGDGAIQRVGSSFELADTLGWTGLVCEELE